MNRAARPVWVPGALVRYRMNTCSRELTCSTSPPDRQAFSLVREMLAVENLPGKKGIRMCHGGTLDPFASGLLLILAGPATRLFEYLHSVPKVYDATVRWGVETDNGDPLGQAAFCGDATQLSPGVLDAALQSFVGWHDQIPPSTSAKRVDGERAYVRVHRGETFVMPPSRVYLHEARWTQHDLPEQSSLRLVARGGYYARALARDLGRAIGCGAHLRSLHRRGIGPWIDPGAGRQVCLRGDEILPWRPRMLSDQDVGKLRQNGAIQTGLILPPTWSLPTGFPDPQAPVRGMHLGKLIYLLEPVGQNLTIR